jgi:hypothetical protein
LKISKKKILSNILIFYEKNREKKIKKKKKKEKRRRKSESRNTQRRNLHRYGIRVAETNFTATRVAVGSFSIASGQHKVLLATLTVFSISFPFKEVERAARDEHALWRASVVFQLAATTGRQGVCPLTVVFPSGSFLRNPRKMCFLFAMNEVY